MTDRFPVNDAVAAIRAEASVAGGMVQLRLSGLDELAVVISHTYYQETSDDRLGADLARGVRLLAARRQEAMESAGLSGQVRPVAGSRLATEFEEFNREADAWSSEVVSVDGCLAVTTVGMREFAVEIDPEVRRGHPVELFCDHAGRLGTELIRQRVEAMIRQRMEYQRREDDARVLGLR
jgi:hypothetical protein